MVAHKLPQRRDRRLVTWAGVVPDLDALSRFWGVGAYLEYHHVLTHGVVAAVAVTGLSILLARDRLKVALLSLVTFHLHLLCDLVGSGADNSPWPLTYLWPFSPRVIISPYGWDLASPANAFIWMGAVAVTIWIGVTQGRTFAEAFLPARADAAIVATLRKMFARVRPAAPQQ